jgi:hypothetical protein
MRRLFVLIVSVDVALAIDLEAMLGYDSFTLIFVGTSDRTTEQTVYEPEFEEPLNMELKRNLQASPRKPSNNETQWEKLPLFEKYQFFTSGKLAIAAWLSLHHATNHTNIAGYAGIIMGLVATLVLGSILTVGLKALASLEVSYGAFEKDQGPAAQKKQQ